MTDNLRQPGDIPERPNDAPATDGTPSTTSNETAANGAHTAQPAGAAGAQPADGGPVQPAGASVVQPADVAADAAATQPLAPNGTPRPAEAPAASAGHTAAYPTDAYPTDAFGQRIQGGQAPYPTYNPYAADPSYGAENGQPGMAQASGKAAGRRKGSAALVAALAIGALVGGASGAGVTAFVLSNQSNGVPASEAQGPSNVVVNDSENVNQITAVAAKASPSVVTIDVAGANATQSGTGSGVILTEDGYVLTNTHVVTLDGVASNVTIQVQGNDGRLFSATVVGTDPVSDLAVIKIEDADNLQPITWGDSDELNVGDTTIAIGAPLGLSGTVTNGIVSALNRSITVASSAAPSTPEESEPDDGEEQGPFDFYFDIPGQEQDQAPQGSSSISLSVVQTDAAINPGNSGGALLNGTGELIGINVAIANASNSGAAGSIGVGFAVPSNLAKRVSDEIISSGKATHGLLGASVGNAAGEPGITTVGALIADVTSGGAAEKAGLREGDVVTNFNGVPITDANDLTAQVRALPAGGEAELTYVRNGESITVSVAVGELSN
jgi:putative serine protease PepD